MSEARITADVIRAQGPLLLATAGVLLFGLAWEFRGDDYGYWLPGLGVGMALLSWFGWRMLPILAAVLLVLRWFAFPAHAPSALVLADVFVHVLHMGAAWWLYHHLAKGASGLDDPRSATVFLLLGPGVLAAGSGAVMAFLWCWWQDTMPGVAAQAAQLFLSRAVGVVVVYPFLIVLATPLLMRCGLLHLELPATFFGGKDEGGPRYGDRVELVGLTFATSMLALLLLWADFVNWILWGGCLILIVWTCIRQGLRGGCFAATVASLAILFVVHNVQAPAEDRASIQGHLLAFCSTALLLGVSASWIRANETRYRHVVNRVPFVLYSVRLPYGIPTLVRPEQAAPRKDSKVDLQTGPAISQLASVVLVSPACKTVLDRDPDTLIGAFTLWLDMIEPDDREIVVASLAQLCLQKQPVTCEYRLRGPVAEISSDQRVSGKPRSHSNIVFRWVRDTLTPHYAEDGLVDGWEGLVEDITDQRVLSHNLRKMTNMLQVLVANLPTGVYFVQAPTGFPILVNARARQLLGQREDLSAGLEHLSKIYRLHRPDGSEYPWQELPVCKALKNGVACRANDIVVHRGDGRKIPLLTWAAPVDLHNTGNPDAAVWVLEDWSAIQQAQESLRQARDKYQSLVETIPFMLLQRDRDFNITYLNPAAQELTGYSADEMMQPNFWDSLLNADDLLAYLAAADAVRQGKPARLEARFRAKDQTQKTVLAFLQPNFHDGAVVGSTSLVVDISMQRRLEEELQQAKHLELVGRLASGTVHDFNNLLQILLGLAGLAKYEVEEAHPVWQHLVRIEEAGEQAAHLAGQLLTFSKQRPRQTHAVDLNAVVTQTLKLAKSVMPADIGLESRLDPSLPLVLGDEIPFKQVLMNLCINARDALPEGGRITISTDLVTPHPESSSNGVRWVHLAVQDTGHGMEDSVRQRIFEPFFSTKERGTGLGLAVVAQIVKEFGGRIEVASQPGAGTRFDIWLAPAKSEQLAAV